MVVFNDGLIGVIKNYLHKGSKVYVEGSLQTRKWTDQSGAEKYSTEVVLQGFGSALTMLDSRSAGGDAATSSGGGYQANAALGQNSPSARAAEATRSGQCRT